MQFMQLYPAQTKSIQLKAAHATHSDECDLLKPIHIPRRPCDVFRTLRLIKMATNHDGWVTNREHNSW